MRLIIADDHTMVADALKSMIEKRMSHATVTKVKSIRHVIDMLDNPASTEPDLIILDLNMPDINGLQGLRMIKKNHPQVPVAMISGYAPPEDIELCMQSGAAGFIPKSATSEELMNAIQQILKATGYQAPPDAASEINLTRREKQIVQFLAKGARNKDIASDLGISEVTTKIHVRNVCMKMGVKNRTQAALKAKEIGLVKEG